MTGSRASHPEPRAFELSTQLEAPVVQVWSCVTDFNGINAEMRPLLRMTVPREWTNLTLEQVRLGERLFRSWLLLFGVLPIDFDDLAIAQVGPGYRFVERSRMLSASLWEHERLVESTTPGTCLVTDRVRFTPRWKPLGFVLGQFVPIFCVHRHRRLRQTFGGKDQHPSGH